MFYSYLSWERSVLSRNEEEYDLSIIRAFDTDISSLETDISANTLL